MQYDRIRKREGGKRRKEKKQNLVVDTDTPFFFTPFKIP